MYSLHVALHQMITQWFWQMLVRVPLSVLPGTHAYTRIHGASGTVELGRFGLRAGARSTLGWSRSLLVEWSHVVPGTVG